MMITLDGVSSSSNQLKPQNYLTLARDLFFVSHFVSFSEGKNVVLIIVLLLLVAVSVAILVLLKVYCAIEKRYVNFINHLLV